MGMISRGTFALCLMAATPALPATFNIFEAGTTTQLGTFDAPVAGGAVTSAVLTLAGGVFDVLDLGAQAPVYDAVNNWIVGTGSSFGSVTNSVAFNTTDFLSNPITCQIGECVFSFTNSGGGGVPAEWYLDYIPGNPANAAPIDLGYYDIVIAPVPLPATALLLVGALAGLVRMRRRAAAH